jgi:hypothetical protein
MKKILVCAVTLLSLSTAFAQVSYSMPALEGGFKWNSMDFDGSNSNNQVVGFQFGGSVIVNFSTQFGLRTGLFYNERPFKSEFTGLSDVEGKITYADIPVHLMLKLEDYAGIYIGPSISTKIGDEVKGGTLTGVKSSVMPLTVGAQFKFAPNFGLNIFFETISSSLAKELTASRGIGANFVLAFD